MAATPDQIEAAAQSIVQIVRLHRQATLRPNQHLNTVSASLQQLNDKEGLPGIRPLATPDWYTALARSRQLLSNRP